LGYGLTGNVNEHIFLMLYGEEGRNGKDTLMSVLARVLGETVGAVSNDVIIASGKQATPGSAKPHLCSLQGKRIAWASETDKGARFDIAQVKFLTGGGSIPARHLYGEDFTFEPSHLLVLLTNNKPHADASDKAFWERLCPITFNLRFVDQPQAPNERKKDTRLGQALQAEASGILAWLVRGCLDWQKIGLQIPACILRERKAYQGEEDTLGQFLDECCVITPQAKVKAILLYARYAQWCEQNRLKAMTGTAFGLAMGKRYRRDREKHGMHYYGIGLLATDELMVKSGEGFQKLFTTARSDF
jgi:putative DNA primase/helicase